MKYLIPTLIIISSLLLNCSKNENPITSNAEVIEFNPNKCGCCWGWKFIIGNDTITSSDGILGDIVGYEISDPIPIYIELGEKVESCSSISFNLEYYNIKRIEKVN